jgi:flagellar motor switch protein FliN
VSGGWLHGSRLRLAVELGRAQLAVDDAVALTPGAIVALDRGADEPVELFLNGAPFARGRLLRRDGDRVAVQIEDFVIASGRGNPGATLRGPAHTPV